MLWGWEEGVGVTDRGVSHEVFLGTDKVITLSSVRLGSKLATFTSGRDSKDGSRVRECRECSFSAGSRSVRRVVIRAGSFASKRAATNCFPGKGVSSVSLSSLCTVVKDGSVAIISGPATAPCYDAMYLRVAAGGKKAGCNSKFVVKPGTLTATTRGLCDVGRGTCIGSMGITPTQSSGDGPFKDRGMSTDSVVIDSSCLTKADSRS